MDDSFIPLAPVHFFEIGASLHYLKKGKESLLETNKTYLLPSTSFLCGEAPFADVAMGWNEEGIHAWVNVKKPFEKVVYPNVQAGDSIHFFFDTRDVKTSGWNTRFCHHFFFLPESFEGTQAGEITRFRGEDQHELCPGDLLKVTSKILRTGYVLKIFIPENCLVGYDPSQFKRLGFSYQILGPKGLCQHFSALSGEYPIEQLPSLWSSLQLVDQKNSPL